MSKDKQQKKNGGGKQTAGNNKKPSQREVQHSQLNRALDDAGQISGMDAADLQGTYGNRFLQRLVGAEIDKGGPSDAPGTADADTAEAAHTQVDRQADADGRATSGAEIEERIEQSRGSGQALPGAFRKKMEGHFDTDFSDVRVHNNDESDQLNRSLGAKAFTTGSDIYFRKSDYDPAGEDGQKLIAHELTHVVQQGGVQRKGAQAKLAVSEPDDEYEKEADAVAEAAVQAPAVPNAEVSSTDPLADSPEGAPPTAGAIPDPDVGPAGAAPKAKGGPELPDQAADATDKTGIAEEDLTAVHDKAVEEAKEEGGDPKEAAKRARKRLKSRISNKPDKGQTEQGEGEKEGKGEGEEAADEKKGQEKEKLHVGNIAAKLPKVEMPDPDQAEELKYDETAIEEPEMPEPLMSWNELAYGTIQLQDADLTAEELAWRNGLLGGEQGEKAGAAAQDTFGADTDTLTEGAALKGGEGGEVDRAKLIGEAVGGGILEGVVQGASEWAVDTAIESLTSSIPYADGWIGMANNAITIGKDGGDKWWAGFTAPFSAEAAVGAFGGWGKIGEETTPEGMAAFVVEKVLGIINWIGGILGFFQQILQMGIALLYLAWGIANAIPGGQPVAAAIMSVIKFLETILKFLIWLNNLINMIKPVLQLTAMGLRISDLARAKGDPEQLMAKAAKLRGHASGFAQGMTQRGLETAKSRYYDKPKAKKKAEQARQQAEADVEAIASGAKKPEDGQSKEEAAQAIKKKYEEESGEKYDRDAQKAEAEKNKPSTAITVLKVVTGVNPTKAKDEFQDFKNAGKDFKATTKGFKGREEYKAAQGAKKRLESADDETGAVNRGLQDLGDKTTAVEQTRRDRKAGLDEAEQSYQRRTDEVNQKRQTADDEASGIKQQKEGLSDDIDRSDEKAKQLGEQADKTDKEAKARLEEAEVRKQLADDVESQAKKEQDDADQRLNDAIKRKDDLERAEKEALAKDDQAELARIQAAKKKADMQLELVTRDHMRVTADGLAKDRQAKMGRDNAEADMARAKQQQDEASNMRQTAEQEKAAIRKKKSEIDELNKKMDQVDDKIAEIQEAERKLREQEDALNRDRENDRTTTEEEQGKLDQLARQKESLEQLRTDLNKQTEDAQNLLKKGDKDKMLAGRQNFFKGMRTAAKDFDAGGQRHGAGITGVSVGLIDTLVGGDGMYGEIIGKHMPLKSPEPTKLKVHFKGENDEDKTNQSVFELIGDKVSGATTFLQELSQKGAKVKRENNLSLTIDRDVSDTDFVADAPENVKKDLEKDKVKEEPIHDGEGKVIGKKTTVVISSDRKKELYNQKMRDNLSGADGKVTRQDELIKIPAGEILSLPGTYEKLIPYRSDQDTVAINFATDDLTVEWEETGKNGRLYEVTQTYALSITEPEKGADELEYTVTLKKTEETRIDITPPEEEKKTTPAQTKRADDGRAADGLIVQRAPADEEEEMMGAAAPPGADEKPLEQLQAEKEADAFMKLPEPPDEAIYEVNTNAAAYNAMRGEQFALQVKQQELHQMHNDNLAQQMEADAAKKAIAKDEMALEMHEKDAEQRQDAQKGQEEAAKEAQQPANEGFDISREISKLLASFIQPLIEGITQSGDETGTGSQSKETGELESFGGTQDGAVTGAKNITEESEAEAKRWQAQTAAVQNENKQHQAQYRRMNQQVDKQQEDVEGAQSGLEDAAAENQETLDEINSQMEESATMQEDAVSDAEDWADEHRTLRETLYTGIEEDLIREEERRLQQEEQQSAPESTPEEETPI